MSLTREEEQYWVLWIVNDLRQAIQVCEEQVSTLVCSETTAETNHQSVRVDTLEQRYYTSWITLVLQPSLCKLLTNISYELLLQCHTGIPDFSI